MKAASWIRRTGRRIAVPVTDWLWNWAFAHQCPTWIRKLAHRLDLAVNPPRRDL